MKKTSLLTILICLFVSSLHFSCKTDRSTDENIQSTKPFKVTSRIRADPDRLNPLLTIRSWSLHVNNHLFLPLLEFHPKSLELSPVLAKSRPKVELLEESKYGRALAYTFEIHEEAVWDNGSPVLASDYLFTLKAVMNPKTPKPQNPKTPNIVLTIAMNI